MATKETLHEDIQNLGNKVSNLKLDFLEKFNSIASKLASITEAEENNSVDFSTLKDTVHHLAVESAEIKLGVEKMGKDMMILHVKNKTPCSWK